MASFEPLGSRAGIEPTTCLVVTAGLGLVDTLDRIEAELEQGWAVQVVATPNAQEWFESSDMPDKIEALTGARPDAKLRDPWAPKPDTMFHRCVVAPLTLNTLTKWAAGHADNLALSMLCEATWSDDVPVIAHLTLNGAYRAHPKADESIAVLRDAGVQLVPYEIGEAMKQIVRARQPHQTPQDVRDRVGLD